MSKCKSTVEIRRHGPAHVASYEHDLPEHSARAKFKRQHYTVLVFRQEMESG